MQETVIFSGTIIGEGQRVECKVRATKSLLDEGPHDGKTVIPAAKLAPQVIRPQVAYLLADMMTDVIRRGTGVAARVLNRDGTLQVPTDFSQTGWWSGGTLPGRVGLPKPQFASCTLRAARYAAAGSDRRCGYAPVMHAGWYPAARP